jgi:hypothetical protein
VDNDWGYSYGKHGKKWQIRRLHLLIKITLSMKNALFFSALTIFAIACDSTSGGDAVRDFIPGTYVCPFKDSIYATTNVVGIDTLRIARQTGSGSETYQIDRSKRFTQTEDGTKLPEKFETETWTASYQEADKTMYIKNTGGTIAFDVKNRLLKIGKKEYRKIE